MGIGNFIGRLGKQYVVDESFRRGANGEPPMATFLSEEAQKIADEAYEKGQKSVLVKIGNKVAKE